MARIRRTVNPPEPVSADVSRDGDRPGDDYSFLAPEHAFCRDGWERRATEVAALLAGSDWVKNSHSTRAGLTEEVFVKRYNPRGWLHRIKRLFRQPRAYRCLAAARRLEAFGIATPKVLWAGRDFLVTERLPESARLLDAAPVLPGPELAEALVKIHASGVYHGDLNLRNLYTDGDRFGVIDLDGAEIYPPDGVPERRRRRDLARLISSWIKAARKAGWSCPDPDKITALFAERYRLGGGGELDGNPLRRRVRYLAQRIRTKWKPPAD